MPFITFCNSENKDCRKEVEPEIEKSTGKVFCPECDLEVKIDPFMKNQLIAMGQVKKDKKTNTPFAVECPNCKKKGKPTVKGSEVFCSSCSHNLTDVLSKPYIEMLKTVIK